MACLTGVGIGFHQAFGSDGWPHEMHVAFRYYNTAWFAGEVMALAVLLSLWFDRNDTPRRVLLAWSLIASGLANLTTAWWYLYTSNSNSDLKMPVRTWILSTVACICWTVSGILYSKWPQPQQETPTREPLLNHVLEEE